MRHIQDSMNNTHNHSNNSSQGGLHRLDNRHCIPHAHDDDGEAQHEQQEEMESAVQQPQHV